MNPPRREASRRLRGWTGDVSGFVLPLSPRGASIAVRAVRWCTGPGPARRKAHRRRGSRCPCAHRLHAVDVGRAARAVRPPLRPSLPPESSPGLLRPARAVGRRAHSGRANVPGAGQCRPGWRSRALRPGRAPSGQRGSRAFFDAIRLAPARGQRQAWRRRSERKPEEKPGNWGAEPAKAVPQRIRDPIRGKIRKPLWEDRWSRCTWSMSQV